MVTFVPAIPVTGGVRAAASPPPPRPVRVHPEPVSAAVVQLAKQMNVSFVGLLKEESKEVLPHTLRTILITQFHEIFFNNPGGWWMSSGGGYAGFVREIVKTSLCQVIKDNTNADVGDDCFHVSG